MSNKQIEFFQKNRLMAQHSIHNNPNNPKYQNMDTMKTLEKLNKKPSNINRKVGKKTLVFLQ